MEGHAVVHLTLPTVSVPVGTEDPTARTEVHNQEHACMHAAICPWSICTWCVSYLQLAVLPVLMEEHALVHLPMLPVSVPVHTQGPTARTEVGTTQNMHACACVCVCVCACASMAYSEVQFT